MKVLVVGASGLIGSTMYRVLSERKEWKVFGTIRDFNFKRYFQSDISSNLIHSIDVLNSDQVLRLLSEIKPDVVVNCAGLTKHKDEANNPLVAIPINSLIPHRLANYCGLIGARLIHVSTDCVFSGNSGDYKENDSVDAQDIYGKSKSLGELYYPNTITLRTSTIGHELNTNFGLLDWFLAQEESCNGYTRAIFSGLPTLTFAQIVRDVIIPNKDLQGLYHISAKSISKFELLNIIAGVYEKKIKIVPFNDFVINRSLNSDKFRLSTGYIAPDWLTLIKQMHLYQKQVIRHV